MDIRKWSLNQIMQLPDNCFGRRFVVSCTQSVKSGTVRWDISEIALPERFVLWELYAANLNDSGTTIDIKIALGDQLPTAVAQMAALEPLISGLGAQGPDPREISNSPNNALHLVNIKQPIQSSGRRLVVEFNATAGFFDEQIVAIVISSIPNEVPDCLLSV